MTSRPLAFPPLFGNILGFSTETARGSQLTIASLSSFLLSTFISHCSQDSLKCPKNIDSFKSSPVVVGRAPALAV